MIRERQKKGEAVYFYPLVLTPTPKIALDLVRDKNLSPMTGGRCLNTPSRAFPPHERSGGRNRGSRGGNCRAKGHRGARI